MSVERIRELNDAFRRSFAGGKVMMTGGIAALSEEARQRVYNRVKGFDAFTPENDPHREHDFGSVEVDGTKVFWKIDYYDAAMEFGSEEALAKLDPKPKTEPRPPAKAYEPSLAVQRRRKRR